MSLCTTSKQGWVLVSVAEIRASGRNLRIQTSPPPHTRTRGIHTSLTRLLAFRSSSPGVKHSSHVSEPLTPAALQPLSVALPVPSRSGLPTLCIQNPFLSPKTLSVPFVRSCRCATLTPLPLSPLNCPPPCSFSLSVVLKPSTPHPPLSNHVKRPPSHFAYPHDTHFPQSYLYACTVLLLHRSHTAFQCVFAPYFPPEHELV